MPDYQEECEHLRWKIKTVFLPIVESLEEILHYTGGADNALEDEYVMERAEKAIDKTKMDAG